MSHRQENGGHVPRAIDDRRVGIAAGVPGYGSTAPFEPRVAPPEYPFDRAPGVADDNPAYAGVRLALAACGLDRLRLDSPEWNPLGALIEPGQTVLIKPNLVRDFRETKTGDGDCLITHGAVLRAVIDYAYSALQGRGRLLIADAPQNDADFAGVSRVAALRELQAFYRHAAGFAVEVIDLRPECADKIDGVIVGHRRLAGDPAGYCRVDLARHSAFAAVGDSCHRLYGSEYDTAELRRAHLHGEHAYLVSQSVLDADVVLNVPKLKTHKKCGLTACLKNLVGINGNKNLLPHYRIGDALSGGDEFARNGLTQRVERQVMQQFRRWFPLLGPARQRLAGPIKAVGKRLFGDTNSGTIRSGNWHGNDTVWRMVLDLNRILHYARRDGTLSEQPVRRVFNIVDAIIAGEGDGPLNADPHAAGLVVAGANGAAVDRVCATLMGFDPDRLPLVARPFDQHRLPLATFAAGEIEVYSGLVDAGAFGRGWPARERSFVPHFGWRGHIEAHATEGEVAA